MTDEIRKSEQLEQICEECLGRLETTLFTLGGHPDCLTVTDSGSLDAESLDELSDYVAEALIAIATHSQQPSVKAGDSALQAAEPAFE